MQAACAEHLSKHASLCPGRILRRCFQARWAQDSSRLQSLHLLLVMTHQQGIFLGLQNLISAFHCIDPALEAARPTMSMPYGA